MTRSGNRQKLQQEEYACMLLRRPDPSIIRFLIGLGSGAQHEHLFDKTLTPSNVGKLNQLLNPPRPPLQGLHPPSMGVPHPLSYKTLRNMPHDPHLIYHPHRHRSTGCCRHYRYCSHTLCLLFLFISITSFLYIYLIINSIMPTYNVRRFSITALDINPKDGNITRKLAVTVQAKNPHKKVGVCYKDGGWAAVACHGVALCLRPLPMFYQEAQNLAVMAMSLKGWEKLEVGVVAALELDQDMGSVLLEVTVRVTVGLRVGEADLREVVVKDV